MSITEQITNYNNGLLASYQAVREKKGAVPTNKNFVNLPDAIRSIQGGGGVDFFPYVTMLRFQNVKTFPEEVTLNLNNLTDMGYTFAGTNIKKLTLNNLEKVSGAITSAFDNMQNATEITLNGLTNKITSINSSFTNSIGLITINCEFDMTNVTNANGFSGCYQLRNIEFAENTLSVNLSLSYSRYLTDESLVSVANSLVSGSHTLTLHADSKALCNTIKGTVDNSKGYAVFVKDDTGTTTLTEFITVTKGWTIA